MVKDTMKRKKPSFNEAYHGYRTFSECLEDAQKEGLLELDTDKRSRTYVVTRFGSELNNAAPPAVKKKTSRRRRPSGRRRVASPMHSGAPSEPGASRLERGPAADGNAVPPDQRHSVDVLADHLVDTGKLSRFQADKLRQGMALGLVLGPFHVLTPLGKGGMGTVYLARDSRSQLLVALKVLPPKRAREEERLLARFQREMEMCRRVAHPHLAWAYEVGVCQGVYYIAMEYIPGQSLYRLVNDQGPLEIARAARLFSEVASALEHAHNQGLIHRDMKPSNIIITPHDHAKVLDLDLALVQR